MYGCSINSPAFWDKKKHSKDFQGPPIHMHDVHELYFLISGSTTYFICDEIVVLQAGDMIFIPKNMLHRTEYNNNEGVERVVFSFGDDFVGEEFFGYLEEMAANKHTMFDSHGLHRITDLVSKIENEIQKKKVGSTKMQELYFKQLLILISRYRKHPPSDDTSPLLAQITNIVDYINKNYNTDISLNTLSHAFSISPSHLSKNFKRVTGTGIKEYINILRIEAAKDLLLATDLSITEIAMRCGFNDSNYFAAVFKALVGITPKKYSMFYKKD